MNAIYSWVKSIVFFLVLMTIINNLIGKSSYKKYINLISGMILIILVVSPLLNIFNIDEKLDYYFDKNAFMTSAYDINRDLIQMEETQLQVVIEEYKNEIKNKTKLLLEKENLYISEFVVKIDEDNNSDSFGKIEKIDLIASYIVNKESDSLDSLEPIEKVEFEKIEIGPKEETYQIPETELSDNEIYIKNLLSDFYNINLDNINISIET